MRVATIKALKKEIGYTEEKRGYCSNCANMIERDGIIDRTWDCFCQIFEDTIGEFEVESFGVCNHYEDKNK